MHLLMDDSVMLDQRTDGVVLRLISAALERTLERRVRRKLFLQIGFVMSLAEMAPKVALGLAEIAAESASDHERRRIRWVWVVDELV